MICSADRFQQPLRIKGFTLLELMYVVLVIGVLMTIALPIYINFLDQAKATRLLPYAKVSMEYLAGYHSIYGDWPNEVENPFQPPGGLTQINTIQLSLGHWPRAMTYMNNQPVWIDGGIATHDGSLLMTSNVIDRREGHTMAFYVRPVLFEGQPTAFVWDCAERRAGSAVLPNPTTLRSDALPSVCRPPVEPYLD
ncbi:MAG: type II secretion system protein [Pseudomonadota bacterium]